MAFRMQAAVETLKPLKGKLLVKIPEQPDMTTSGLVALPEVAIHRQLECVICAVGEENPYELKPGMRILMDRYAASNRFFSKGVEYAMADVKDLYGVLES